MMNFEKIQLDEKIILYKNVFDLSIFNNIKDLESVESNKDIWSFASTKNVKNNNHIHHKKVLNLPKGDVLVYVNNKNLSNRILEIKFNLDMSLMPCILDYSKTLEISIKKISHWTIYSESKFELDEYHFDSDNDGNKFSYSVLACLNKDFFEGEILFKDRVGNEKIKLSLGDVLIYPSNIDYTHKEFIATHGEKYMAISYFN